MPSVLYALVVTSTLYGEVLSVTAVAEETALAEVQELSE